MEEVEIDQELVEELRRSKQKFGALAPIVLDKGGNIVEGHHRDKADSNWPRITYEEIETEEDRILYAIAFNWHRRGKSENWKTQLLSRLAELGWNVEKIAERTGLSKRTVYRYLPSEFKDETKASAARVKSAASLATKSQDTRQETTTQDTRELVACEFCNVGTSDPQTWHNHTLCPECKIKADLNPEPFDRKFKRGRLPPELKAKEIKPKSIEKWKDRKARMHPQHSKAENKIVQKLRNANLGPVITERFFCAEGSIPDAYLPKYHAIVYVDGQPHEGREDRDDLLRQKVAERNRVRVLPVKVKNDSDKETERGFNEIMEALQQ